jgi:putative transposase
MGYGQKRHRHLRRRRRTRLTRCGRGRYHRRSVGLVTKDDGWEVPDALWARLEPLLPPRKAHPLGCHRPRVPDRDALRGILYIVRTGMQWGALDGTGICSTSSTFRRFREWSRAGVFLEFWQRSLREYADRRGIAWRWMSMDGAMTKAPLGGEDTGPNPTDRAKRGTKRSIITDARGVPVGLAIAGANRHDSKMLRETILGIPVRRPRLSAGRPLNLCLDKGYDYRAVREVLAELGITGHIRCRGEEQRKVRAGQKARRWVVERAHSWMNRWRAVLVRWAKRSDNYTALLHLVLGIITLRVSGALR